MKRIPSPLAMLVVLVVANLILLIAGCASVPKTASETADPYGRWDVVSFDGEAVTNQHGFEWWFQLRSNGSLLNVLYAPAVPAGGSETGEFSLGEEEDGCRTIEVVLSDGQLSGSICGDVLTLEAEGKSMVLHKRHTPPFALNPVPAS